MEINDRIAEIEARAQTTSDPSVVGLTFLPTPDFEYLIARVRELEAENERLLAGQWTADEINNICHNMHGTVDADDLAVMRDGTKLTRAGLVAMIVEGNLQIQERTAERDEARADVARLTGEVERLRAENAKQRLGEPLDHDEGTQP